MTFLTPLARFLRKQLCLSTVLLFLFPCYIFAQNNYGLLNRYRLKPADESFEGKKLELSGLCKTNDKWVAVSEGCNALVFLDENNILVKPVAGIDPAASLEAIVYQNDKYYLLDENNMCVYKVKEGKTRWMVEKKWTLPKEVYKTGSLESMAISPNGNYLYILGEHGPEQGETSLYVFTTEPGDNKLKIAYLFPIALDLDHRYADMTYDPVNKSLKLLEPGNKKDQYFSCHIKSLSIDLDRPEIAPRLDPKWADISAAVKIPNSDKKVYHVEGIALDGEGYYIISDNDNDGETFWGKIGNQNLPIKNIDITFTEADKRLLAAAVAENLKEQEERPEEGSEKPIEKSKIKKKAKQLEWSFAFNDAGKLLTGYPTYMSADDVLKFDVSNIKVIDNHAKIMEAINSSDDSIKTDCEKVRLKTSDCCFNDYHHILDGYTDGALLLCQSNCCKNPSAANTLKISSTKYSYPDISATGITEMKKKEDLYKNTNFNLTAKNGRVISFKINITDSAELLQIAANANDYTYSISDTLMTENKTDARFLSKDNLTYRETTTTTTLIDKGEIIITKGSDFTRKIFYHNASFVVIKKDTTKEDTPVSFQPTIAISIKQKGRVLLDEKLNPVDGFVNHFIPRKALEAKNIKFRKKDGFEIEFSVITPNVKNVLVDQYLKKMQAANIKYFPYNNLLSSDDIDKLKKSMDALYSKIQHYKIAEINVKDKACAGGIPCANTQNNENLTEKVKDSVRMFFKEYAEPLGIVDQILCRNNEWLRATYWINKKPLMNPFVVYSLDDLNAQKVQLESKIAKTKAQIDILNERAKQCCKENAPPKADITSELIALNQQNNNYQDDLDRISKQLTQGAAVKNNYLNKQEVYNKGTLYLSQRNNYYMMRAHDASNNLERDDEKMPFDQARYEQNENVKLIEYNIANGAKAAINSTLTNVKDDVNIIQDNVEFLESLSTVSSSIEAAGKQKSGNDAKAEQDSFECFLNYYGKVLWLSKQTIPLYTDGLPMNTGPARFSTLVKDPNPSKKAAVMVKYIMDYTPKDGNLVTDTVTYNVYRKQYIQITAGITGAPIGTRSSPKYDATTRSFSNIDFAPIDVVTGVKIFPFGLNVRRWWPSYRSGRYGRMLINRGDHALNRFYLFAGLSVSQKQLHNYFAGVGYDLIPGLGLNMGCNLYGSNRYTIENNAVTKQREAFLPALYLGISIDPVVFVKISNIFNFKF